MEIPPTKPCNLCKQVHWRIILREMCMWKSSQSKKATLRHLWVTLGFRDFAFSSDKINERPRTHPNRTHPKAESGWVFEFFCPSPHEAAVLLFSVCRPKHVYFSIRMSSSLRKCLILMVCFSSEKPYHDHGDSLVWTGPQWAGPLAVVDKSANQQAH